MCKGPAMPGPYLTVHLMKDACYVWPKPEAEVAGMWVDIAYCQPYWKTKEG